MEQAMNDDQLRRALFAQAKFLDAIRGRCVMLIWSLDAFKRGEHTNGWEYLFWAEEAADEADECGRQLESFYLTASAGKDATAREA
jgi:hypothetical protein